MVARADSKNIRTNGLVAISKPYFLSQMRKSCISKKDNATSTMILKVPKKFTPNPVSFCGRKRDTTYNH